MFRTAIFLAFLSSALASPLFDFGDIKPEPGCHYNISAMPHFNTYDGAFEFYVDSITSPQPLNGWTCLKWNGHINRKANNTGTIDFQWKIVSPDVHRYINCTGANFVDQPADFLTQCVVLGTNHKFTLQMRVALLGRHYVFLTFCTGMPTRPQWYEFMAFFSSTKKGVIPPIRSEIIDKLVAAGWDKKQIQRVPSQNGC